MIQSLHIPCDFHLLNQFCN